MEHDANTDKLQTRIYLAIGSSVLSFIIYLIAAIITINLPEGFLCELTICFLNINDFSGAELPPGFLEPDAFENSRGGDAIEAVLTPVSPAIYE